MEKEPSMHVKKKQIALALALLTAGAVVTTLIVQPSPADAVRARHGLESSIVPQKGTNATLITPAEKPWWRLVSGLAAETNNLDTL